MASAAAKMPRPSQICHRLGLKTHGRDADTCAMRLDRLVVGSGGRTLAADLHPGLTVIGGLEPAGREALVGELLDALAGARPGVHLEVELGGRSLAVFRPERGPHRVIDTDSVTDVTAAHVAADGEIDLFASLGVDRDLARGAIRFGREDLVLRRESDAWIARLATADQERLWDTAMRCRAAERLLEQAAAGGVSADDAPIVREIEERHAALVEATDRYERVRLIALTIGTVGALGAVGAASLEADRWAGVPFLAIALFGIVLALRFRRSVDDAAQAERDVLRRAGSDDYSSFHYERVSALLDTDRERRRFMQAVGDHRRAMVAWVDVAGEVPLAFAFDHEHDIRAAAEARAGVEPSVGDGTAADAAAELTRAVLARLDAVRALTPGDEVLPLVVDDPFEGMDGALRDLLLQVLARRADRQQVVVVTADPEVVAWARRHAPDGGVAVVEPEITATLRGAGTDPQHARA